MAYKPTNIEIYDLEEDKIISKPRLIKNNLDLIAKETKKLEESITKTSQKSEETRTRFEQDAISFRHNFLAQWS